jgi:hypothetical protein
VASERGGAQTYVMLQPVGAVAEGLEDQRSRRPTARRVTKQAASGTPLERVTAEGESPVRESCLDSGWDPEYHRAR